MAPLKKTDIALLRFFYAPERKKNDDFVEFKSSDYPPIGPGGYINEWAVDVLLEETATIPRHLGISFREWRIYTSNESLFNIYGDRFSKVMVVLGEDKLSYLFYHKSLTTGPALCGTSDHISNYCYCCVGYQHMMVMDPLLSLVTTKSYVKPERQSVEC